MASRNKGRADTAIADLKQATGKEAIFLELDLANLKKTKAAAESFMQCVRTTLWVLLLTKFAG